ncbi:lysis protein [Arsenophonus sp. PmNCSU2021_1]|uniref:lysis protein n=1 Tax=Arsenophonus sp. PmNCSU2021_1 TaxID=3118989 RepID=UPI002FF01294
MLGATLYYRTLYYDAEKARKIAVSDREKQQVAFEQLNHQMQTISALDARHTKELADVQAKNDDLRRKLNSGGRVLVKGNCPISTTSPSSLGHAGTIELSSIAGRNVLDIRSGIISDQAKIKYLQDYIRRIIDETNKK